MLSDEDRYANLYVIGVVGIAGVTMNILILIIMSMSPLGTTKTTRVYFRAIAFCDLVTLCVRDLAMGFASSRDAHAKCRMDARVNFTVGLPTLGLLCIRIRYSKVGYCVVPRPLTAISFIFLKPLKACMGM